MARDKGGWAGRLDGEMREQNWGEDPAVKKSRDEITDRNAADRSDREELIQGVREHSDALRVLMDNNEILDEVSEGRMGDLDKVRKAWNVEVIGTLRAYQKSGRNNYSERAIVQMSTAESIIRPAIEKLIYKALQSDWGIELDDLTEDEQIEITQFTLGTVQGSLKFEDREGLISEIADRVSSKEE